MCVQNDCPENMDAIIEMSTLRVTLYLQDLSTTEQKQNKFGKIVIRELDENNKTIER